MVRETSKGFPRWKQNLAEALREVPIIIPLDQLQDLQSEPELLVEQI